MVLGAVGAYAALVAAYRTDLGELTPLPVGDLLVLAVGLPRPPPRAGWLLAGREPRSVRPRRWSRPPPPSVTDLHGRASATVRALRSERRAHLDHDLAEGGPVVERRRGVGPLRPAEAVADVRADAAVLIPGDELGEGGVVGDRVDDGGGAGGHAHR